MRSRQVQRLGAGAQHTLQRGSLGLPPPGSPEAQANSAFNITPSQVLFLVRVARAWDEDGLLVPERAELGRFILQCGLARLPDDPALLLTLAHLALEVGRGAVIKRAAAC